MLTAANKRWRCEFCQDFLQFVQQYPTTLHYLWFSDEAHLHLDWFMKKQIMRFSASGSSQIHGNITPFCKMYHVVCS
jgi:hypothetical protein